MKFLYGSTVAVLATSTGHAKEQSYAQPEVYPVEQTVYNYGVPAHAHPEPAYAGVQPPTEYGYSPYAPQAYEPVYEQYVEPVYPPEKKPHPFVDYPSEAQIEYNLPHLGQEHCFLQGAPWTSCGHRSLTGYFLEQCMSIYYSMATNVDGICGEAIPTPPPTAPFENDHIYATEPPTEPATVYPPATEPATVAPPKYGEYKSTEPPTEPVEFTSGYSGSLIAVYQKERCLQNAFVTITAATVMCLTENMIRIKYIEHYAQNAKHNPIEGPTLYLRKMHTFIRSVLSCNGESAKDNYPNLWSEFFNDEGAMTYNPNAPYEVVEGKVQLPPATDFSAAGWEDSVVNGFFICSNPEDLDGSTYLNDPSNKHYNKVKLSECLAEGLTPALNVIGDRVFKECNVLDDGVEKYSDMTLRAMYDSLNPVSTSRVRSFAEIAVQSADVLGQPILEGFGIMYFCAFYACKANNGGDVDGICFPKYDSDLDWSVRCESTSQAELNELSANIDYCLDRNWITNEDVIGNELVSQFNRDVDRSYICQADHEHVDWFAQMTGNLSPNSAWDLVYYRHLATEKCYETQNGLCKDDKELYCQLAEALRSVVGLCNARQAEFSAAKAAHATIKKVYHAPAAAYPQP